MKFPIPLALVASTSLCFAATPPQQDREAILAMAGTFKVDFHFEETVAIDSDYSLKSGHYEAAATEVVRVVEDTPERIALQHLLVVKDEKKDGEPMVIKHWAQIWTWQDTELLDYAGIDGIDDWQRISLSEEEAAGTWSQLVTSVDDTPRYEGYGRWIHRGGESSWTSSVTRRPLPRREYSKRDDYDYLQVVNRHTLSKHGWVHFQDNRKIVARDGEPRVLCFERGLNQYQTTEAPEAAIAVAWWGKHGAFWNNVREFWLEAGERAPQRFGVKTAAAGDTLTKTINRLSEETADPEVIAATLSPFADAR